MNWYLRDGLKPVGPFSEEDIRRRLLSGDVSPEDLLWNDEAGDWRAAISWPEFRTVLVPAFQEVSTVGEAEPVWVILQKGANGPETKGPFSLNEIREALGRGDIRKTDHLWKKGMSGWARIGSRPEFSARDRENPSLV